MVNILADFKISALQLQPGRIKVLGDALSRIHRVAPKLEQSHMSFLFVSDDDLLQRNLKDYENDQAFSAIYRSFDNRMAC